MIFSHHVSLISSWLGQFLTFLVFDKLNSFGEHWSGIF